ACSTGAPSRRSKRRGARRASARGNPSDELNISAGRENRDGDDEDQGEQPARDRRPEQGVSGQRLAVAGGLSELVRLRPTAVQRRQRREVELFPSLQR